MTTSDQSTVAGPVVLIPVKGFDDAKVRLAPTVGPTARAELARSLATGVVGAAHPLPVWVACDDAHVAIWARTLGAAVVWTPGLGLNGAVQAGVAHVEARGATEVIVAHGDLPLAAGLIDLAGFDGVTLVPDRRSDGTNVVVVPADCGFRFSYGPRSFARHLAEADALGCAVRVVRSDDLAWDIDLPSDLDDFAARP